MFYKATKLSDLSTMETALERTGNGGESDVWPWSLLVLLTPSALQTGDMEHRDPSCVTQKSPVMDCAVPLLIWQSPGPQNL